MAWDGKVKERECTSKEDCWNVEALYKGWGEWQFDFERLSRTGDFPKWPELSESNTDLTNPKDLKKLLDALMKLDSELSCLYTYAHLKHDEDVSEEVSKKAYASAILVLHAFQEEVSWIDPAILQLPQKSLDLLLQSEALREYEVYLKKIIRLKPHTLNAKEEKLMAFAGRALESSQRAFSSLNNADLKFPKCLDEKGESHELTLGTYQLHLRNQDRTLRKEAFTHLHQTFSEYENTLCELIQGQVQQHVFYKRARGYDSCLEAALYPHQINRSVYDLLIQTVRKKLPFLHEYIALRKKLLGYSELHFYDLAVPVVGDVDMGMSYEEAAAAIVESVSPLGKEYQDVLRKGFAEERWVDRYENKRKRSGAYSSGCYESMPYILMNYHGTFQDAMTLAHEAGHSMHSYFSCKNQSYQDHRYPIFLAEVASTFHEELLFHHFLESAKTIQQKAYLINQKIDDIRNTLFRQTLFAEYELKLHELVENDQPLTPALLKQEYLKLNKEYFGDSIEMDSELSSEWSRIPHFYYNFYVYQYSTGISAAHVLAKRVRLGDFGAKESYLGFLSSGCSVDPIQTLQRAGVDMTSALPVETLLNSFQGLVQELKKIMEEDARK